MSRLFLILAASLFAGLGGGAEPVGASEPAKRVFGSMASAAALKPAAYGFYSKGCLAGAVAMPYDGPTWQVMRISRNRRWGHPDLIELIEDLSVAAKRGGWNGLLVGDISQPRGGPMLTGHTSHQIGLDADIWLTPMPDRRLSFREREETSAISILKRGTPYVDDRRWNKSFENLLRTAAQYSQTERLLVHPGIKKKLCETVKGDRSWLSKVRPFYGHHYHFHIRIGCPEGSTACRPQKAPPSETGCDESLQWWFDVALAPKKRTEKKKAEKKPEKPRIVTVADLPNECRSVVGAVSKTAELAEYRAPTLAGFTAPALDVPKKFDPLAALSSAPIEASRIQNATSIADVSGGDQRPRLQQGGYHPFFNGLEGSIPVPTPRPVN